ncbi:MAG: hypothetical protein KBS86_01410, partial [Proteobacteria bacterium]|nr:hypothetical protein [Candidatus Enterousia scatequi]
MNKKNTEIVEVVLFIVMGVAMVFGFRLAVAGDESKRETGVVRTKKDSVLYISPVNDTLVDRKMQFTGKPQDKQAYDITSVGDTVKFYNPKHNVNIVATPGCLEKINGKCFVDFKREYNKIKQLQ